MSLTRRDAGIKTDDLQIVDPLEVPQWDRLVSGHRNSTFFHTSEWASVLGQAYGFKPLYLVRRRNDSLSGLLPVMEIRSILTGNRGVSLPFTDFCPPLISSPDDLPDLVAGALQMGVERGWKRLELRGVEPESFSAEPSALYFTHDLTLKDGEDAILSRFSANTRRNIRIAQSKGIRTEECNSPEGIEEYYRLHSITRRRHGLPPQPLNFFRKIFLNIISRGLGSLILAKDVGRVIAGAVFLCYGEKVLFKFGASDTRYHHLRANHLVMWEAIRKYSREDFRELNFGRTDTGNDGLRRFKRSWGSDESTVSYYQYDFRKKDFIKRGTLMKNWQRSMFRKMPLPVSKLAGALLHRHVG